MVRRRRLPLPSWRKRWKSGVKGQTRGTHRRWDRRGLPRPPPLLQAQSQMRSPIPFIINIGDSFTCATTTTTPTLITGTPPTPVPLLLRGSAKSRTNILRLLKVVDGMERGEGKQGGRYFGPHLDLQWLCLDSTPFPPSLLPLPLPLPPSLGIIGEKERKRRNKRRKTEAAPSDIWSFHATGIRSLPLYRSPISSGC